ncbi:hypothetical protein GCM10010990_09520 [Croceicoccus mobilis]|uniref:Anti-sigma K factor RskA C-terminal domain-containing protein n=1 Tax=Croceicoccus mobilis TaxID=1703339 RepID=A0A916YUX5_9SPHN|nr:hypothetical protein GCM10010990_09520 [Croceicoccus mobilis]
MAVADDVLEPAEGVPDMQAGELALGVLEGTELAEARRRQLSDPDFAREVEWWNAQFGLMGQQVTGVMPPAGVWRAIESRIEGMGNHAPTELGRRAPAGWSIATALAGLGAAAAAIALYVSTPTGVPVPAPVPTPAQPARNVLIAQLSDEASGMKLASVVDPTAERLSLSISGLAAAPGKAPELWVVPEGGAPVSLGQIPEDGQLTRELSGEETRLLVAGALVAVTFEDADGTRHEAPTPPIVLAGPLDQV